MKKTSIGFERVVQKVGFETVFHDAEVLRVELRRTGTKPTLEVVILTGRSLRESEIDQSSHRYYIVRLLFRGIEDVELEEFNHQNVIQSLVQTQVDDRWKVHFAGIFGLDLSFTCDEGEVLSIEPSQMKLSQTHVPPTM